VSPQAPAAGLALEVVAHPGVQECLDDGEIILLAVKPSALLILLVSVRVACMGVVVALGLLAATSDPSVPWDARHAIGAGGVIVVARLVWAASDWWNRVYVLTDRRIIVRSGAVPQVQAMPLRDAECVDAGSTKPERLLGLGHVAVRRAPRAPARLAWTCVHDAPKCRKAIIDARQRYAR
jgi:hypothetical protein